MFEISNFERQINKFMLYCETKGWVKNPQHKERYKGSEY